MYYQKSFEHKLSHSLPSISRKTQVFEKKMTYFKRISMIDAKTPMNRIHMNPMHEEEKKSLKAKSNMPSKNQLEESSNLYQGTLQNTPSTTHFHRTSSMLKSSNHWQSILHSHETLEFYQSETKGTISIPQYIICASYTLKIIAYQASLTKFGLNLAISSSYCN